MNHPSLPSNLTAIFSYLHYWLNIFSHPCPLQMPDPEPSFLASRLHLSVGRSGRSVVSHRDLPLGRGDGLPKRSNNHHRFPHPSQAVLLPEVTLCTTPSLVLVPVKGNTIHQCCLEITHWFWTQMASCSEEVQWGAEVLLVSPAQTQTIYGIRKETSFPSQ